jgi:hypothetical protein
MSSLWHLDAEFLPVEDRTMSDAAYGTWLRTVERSRGWV